MLAFLRIRPVHPVSIPVVVSYSKISFLRTNIAIKVFIVHILVFPKKAVFRVGSGVRHDRTDVFAPTTFGNIRGFIAGIDGNGFRQPKPLRDLIQSAHQTPGCHAHGPVTLEAPTQTRAVTGCMKRISEYPFLFIFDEKPHSGRWC